MSSKGSVFIVGPGFIGWEVLDLLVQDGYKVTGFVRRKEHGEQIEKTGAQVVLGDLNDADKIKQETVKHDIVFHTATADHLQSAQAILDGVKVRADDGKSTIYIHTSGTSVLDDSAAGSHKSDKVYSDKTRSDVDSVSDDAPHRPIDLAIVNAQKELGSKAKLSIMIPPLIYGFNPSKGRLTIQIPTLTRFALKHGYAPHVGKGLAVESNIHVLDLARAYVTLLHHVEQSAAEKLLDNPYYFCECTGDKEPSWKDVASAIGEGLKKAGRIESATPKELPTDLYADTFAEYTPAVIGLNSRSRAVRLRELGWQPREKDWRSSYLEDELPEILKEVDHEKFAGYKGTVAS